MNSNCTFRNEIGFLKGSKFDYDTYNLGWGLGTYTCIISISKTEYFCNILRHVSIWLQNKIGKLHPSGRSQYIETCLSLHDKWKVLFKLDGDESTDLQYFLHTLD